jgi:mannose-6-phosphate isomerase-like protein (cupin superfamily)
MTPRKVGGHLLLAAIATAGSLVLHAAESKVDPTFLYRRLDSVAAQASDLTTATARYKPLFGKGDSQAGAVKGLARFGQLIVDAGGQSAAVKLDAEEQAWFVLSGAAVLHYGQEEHSIVAEDFFYLPPGIEHSVSNSEGEPVEILVMGYLIPEGTALSGPQKLQIANTGMARQQVVGQHPDSTLYLLLMGDTTSKRDLIAAGQVLTSLFIMDIKPGGTNNPHHHPTEEEVYLILEGKGTMVAGGGMDGVEGRHPATAGDAYFLRLNATVGFYADNSPGAGNARILAVRSKYPFPR